MKSREDLWKFQNRLIDFFKSHSHCAAWVDMGLGKTVAALTAFADSMRGFEARRMLVVAPKRVARDVWDAEIEEWSHLNGLSISKILGTRDERLRALSRPTDIHTVNREQLAWLFSGFVEAKAGNKFKQIRKWPWDWITLDESQSFKKAGNQRTNAATRISSFGLAQRIVELTGTPSPNGYRDLWSQIAILDGGKRLGDTEDAFLSRWFAPPPDWGYKWVLKDYAAKEIQDAIRDIVISMRAEDYLDLPPVIYNPIYVTLPPAVRKQYQKLERTAVLALKGHTITAANAGVLGNKLLQLASGAMYVDAKGKYQVLHDLKLDVLTELLDELAFSGPVLIGYSFRSDAARIGQRLTRYCGRSRTWMPLRSAASMKAFRDGSVDFGLVHPASAGHGLNDMHLSGSENIVWFGPTNNLEWWDQLNARLAGGYRRMGKNIRIQTILARETRDEDYMQMTVDKDVDQTGLVKALIRDF